MTTSESIEKETTFTPGHQMSFHVPENQAVSWCIYWPSIIREAGVTNDEADPHSAWMMRCYDRGEPIWVAALELKTLVDCNRGYRKEKTPLQLARRVVKVGTP